MTSSGTLHSRDEMKDTGRASLIKERVRSKIKPYSGRPSTSTRRIQASEVMKAFDYDPTKLSKKLDEAVRAGMYVVACTLLAPLTMCQSEPNSPRIFR